MEKIITQRMKFVGLDVHKDSIDVAVAEGGDAAVRHVGRIGGDLAAVDRVLRKVVQEGCVLKVIYEAGPCGYVIYRHLTRRGIDCVVIAPSLIPRKPGERVKTDRRDALMLARLARAGELTAVTVPDEADEAVRDMVRARDDARRAQTVARHQLKGFLLRHGVPYAGKTSWGPAHLRWLGDLKLAHERQQIVFQEYIIAVTAAAERLDRLTGQMIEAAQKWRWASVVAALMGLRGLQEVAAITIVAELGDITRFGHPDQLMAYLGLVPGEYSSGSKRRQGSITKAGNGPARRMLVEAAWCYRHPARVARQLQQRQESLPPTIRAISWRAQLRLCSRYRKLAARGKPINQVTVAIARELAGFIWAIAHAMRAHQRSAAV